jgi:hypothetical protein
LHYPSFPRLYLFLYSFSSPTGVNRKRVMLQ